MTAPTALRYCPGIEIQVEPAHYDWRSYNKQGRWLSYWHQIDEVLAFEPTSCLEIGIGTGIVGQQLSRHGVTVTTIDVDERLGVDRVGDVRALPCGDREFDVVVCCQVLEHLPWHDVPTALGELRRVALKGAVVSVPQSGIDLRFALTVRRSSVNWGTRIRTFRAGSMLDQHYWEVGRRGTPRAVIRKAVRGSGFRIDREYTVPGFTYHRFYVLR